MEQPAEPQAALNQPPPASSRQERMEKLDQRIKQLQQQKKELQRAENAQERKARTKRLIEIGAISLKYFNLPKDTTPEDYQQYVQKLVTFINKARQSQAQPGPGNIAPPASDPNAQP